jgi:hypothetical protein
MIDDTEKFGIGHCAEQVADEAIEFRVGDEMGRLLVQERTPEHAREAD